MTSLKIEKRPGSDWVVAYRWLDPEDRDLKHDVEYMTVYGARTEREALQDANDSLDRSGCGWEVLSVARVGRERMNELMQRPAAAAVPAAATSDEQVIRLWLHGRARGTVRAYRADVAAFLRSGTGLREVTLSLVQDYADTLIGLSSATQARRLSSVKSLLSFAHRIGYLPFNVGAAVALPKVKMMLAQRIMSEEAIVRMLALEPRGRNRVLLRVLYVAGLRISEAIRLQVTDLITRGDGGGQITVFGKGGKTRVVLIPAGLWTDLAALTAGADPDAPVFVSREGGALDASQAHRVVKQAAARAGLPAAVSAHWLRHAHVSHALDRGAPAHLVQTTMGHASLATTSRYAHARPEDSSARYLRA